MGSKNVGSGTLGFKKCGKWDFQDAVSPPPHDGGCVINNGTFRSAGAYNMVTSESIRRPGLWVVMVTFTSSYILYFSLFFWKMHSWFLLLLFRLEVCTTL